jgi:L-asparaginase/Glu-tRNA(Gln) amidotransferase subunit D
VDFAGFESPKAPAIARVGTSIQILAGSGSTKSKSGTASRKAMPRLEPEFSAQVAMIHLTPGFPAAAVEKLLPDLDGLLLVAFPSGTAPTHQPEFHRLMASARVWRLPVMVVTEGIGATGSEYRAGKEMLEAGCLWSGSMTPECAYVKASLLLGQQRGREALKKWWHIELAGEGVLQR